MYKWFNDGKTFPFKAVIIPTNRCNLKCPFCPNALPRTKEKFEKECELKDDEWEKIAKEGLKFGVREWSIIGGGEPMLRRDAVITMFETIKSYNELTECEIITNGTLFEERDIKKLVSINLDRILFSIDAPDAKTHDFLRGVKGSFKKASRSLKTFATWKKKFKTDKPYIKVNMVLNSKNITKIPKMVKFLKKNDVQEIALHPMRKYWKSNQINDIKLSGLGEKILNQNVKQAQKISKKLGIFFNIDMLRTKEVIKKMKNEAESSSTLIKTISKLRCFEPFYSILIDPEGNVSPCSPAGRGIPGLNILNYSLSQIWSSEKFNEVREKILKNIPFNYCYNCGLLDMHEHLRREFVEFVNKNS